MSEPSFQITLSSGHSFPADTRTLLLDAALAAGVPVPFSCRRGACGSCRARVVEGEAVSTPPSILRPAALAQGELLLCQSRACGPMRLDIPDWDPTQSAFETRGVDKRQVTPTVVSGPQQVRPGQSMQGIGDTLRQAGRPTARRVHAEAFLAALPGRHPLERVGPACTAEGLLRARDRSIRAVAEIAAQLRPGMTTAQAIQQADAHLRAMGASRLWHPTCIRFGDDTPRAPREPIDLQRRLADDDIAVIDIGPVWDGHEGDFGDTFVWGRDADGERRRCAQAARDVFAVTRQAWLQGLTGRALYDHAEAMAQARGWQLVRELAGHRVSDFPHALFGKQRLSETDLCPSEMLWVLEIQVRHPRLPIGAFFEDLLLVD